MTFDRRRFCLGALSAGATAALWRPAAALDYPVRPVRLVVGFPPGSSSDLVARVMAQALSEGLGRQVIVDNRAGASGNIAAELVAQAAPDGYTLLFALSSNAINAALYPKLNFDFVRDFAPVGSVDHLPLVMEVNPSVPASTVPEFIAYAKANPGKINMASGGIGSPQHMAGELFQMLTGVQMLHVPYKGAGPALTDLIGGRVQVMFDVVAASIGFIKAGKLRPLAICATERASVLPDVPPLATYVPGFDVTAWHGIAAPAATPREIIERLNSEMNAALSTPAVTAALAQLGAAPAPMSPARFGKLIGDDIATWKKVVAFAHITAE
jgi:tripartite-type tricarboxylate transporter receptor subunit TctC